MLLIIEFELAARHMVVMCSRGLSLAMNFTLGFGQASAVVAVPSRRVPITLFFSVFARVPPDPDPACASVVD